ncbi:hypothetical protein [Thaumasiovibrio subtropicus]|uniref:hypothetical protein n=1 Tax=Thaumasiovibrio subtropicus TaxID=1891207 RepID=UPI000B353B88|nr:hypothetical protein [Thaumasiovibrio subtropicus]
MSSEQFNNGFHLGGSVEKALKGEVDISPVKIFSEAWRLTTKHFLGFVPAIFLMVVAQITIFAIAIEVQFGGFETLIQGMVDTGSITQEAMNAFVSANFWQEIMSGPFVAGISLMGLSHAIGLPTRPTHLFKGFSMVIPATLVMLLMSSIQGLASSFLPFIGLYLTMAFSFAMLLACEKKLPAHHALWVSLRAVNKKIVPMLAIFIVIGVLFMLGLATYGLGLFIVMPFYYNVKGVLYRELFGVTLQVVAKQASDAPQDHFEA